MHTIVECDLGVILEVIGITSGVFLTILGGLYFWWRGKKEDYDKEIEKYKDEMAVIEKRLRKMAEEE